ncbi:MAG: penicillin acylase family protein [Anaerolineales bacterium]
MSPSRVRVLGRILLVLLLIAIVLAAVGVWLARRSFPRTQGTLTLPGLQETVDVYRNSDGVPHIYANNEHDLFLAQGYVHAQDRFWQMDFFRHVGAGRLAEMFGGDQADTDVFLRTMGWERTAEAEYRQLDPETKTILQAYADGVNAYLADHDGSAISLEYAILGLLSPSYEVQPWNSINTLTWAKSMAWDLSGNMDGEIDRAILLDQLSMDQLLDLYPPYPAEHPVIAPSSELSWGGDPTTVASYPESVLANLRGLQHAKAELDRQLAGGFPGIGSNNWVISGDRTASGAPILANDTHLGIQMPSIWYENGLHCRPVSAECRFNVAGFTFAGVPAIIIGHNDRIAWGVTNTGPDVQDLFVEKLNPSNPDEYEVNGDWVPFDIVEEEIQVAGGDPVPLRVRISRHGPIISGSYGPLDDLTESPGIDLPPDYAIALRWTALEPSSLIHSVIRLNLAGDWDSFRAALRYWDVPAQNFVYADIEGNIGYQMPGKIPTRAGGDGWLPVPGWSGEYDWTGMIPFEELPSVFNPASGYIVTANNAVVDDSFPLFLGRDWDRGYRAARISEMIENSPSIDPDTVASIQGDNHNPMADVLVPLLTQLSFDDPALEQAVTSLSAWDRQDHMGSAEAALFNVFWGRLLNRTFFEDLGEGPLPSSSRAFQVVAALVDQPDSLWWDVPDTDQIETRDDLLRWSFETAYDELVQTLGNDPAGWHWGDLHTATFRNQSLGKSGVPPIDALFNRGPFAVSGGTSIVNATAWDPTEGYQVTSLPSERLILDLSSLDTARTIHTTGQSGHAFAPNYIDQADRWRTINFHRLAWDEATVVSEAVEHLRLTP